MQTGDLENQATESGEFLTEDPAIANSESTPQPLSDSTRREQNGSLWQRLRDQRREVSAVVALIVMAIIWFDTGGSREGSDPVSLDPLDGYEAVLSDFTSVGDDRPLRESADPFESSFQNSFGSSLAIPQSPEAAASNTVSADNLSTADGGATPSETASYPEDSRTFNSSGTAPVTQNGSDQPQRRRIRFAGRIQPN